MRTIIFRYISEAKASFHNLHSENVEHLIFIPFVGIEVDWYNVEIVIVTYSKICCQFAPAFKLWSSFREVEDDYRCGN